MSEKDENALPWTSQPCEYEPWRNRSPRTSRTLYYRERVKELTAAMTIWNILEIILTVFGLFALICYIFRPELLLSLEISPGPHCKTFETKASPVQKQIQSILPSSIEGETTPSYLPTDFLSPNEADDLCSKHRMLRWTDHSKPRKVYEIFHIDSNDPEYLNKLHVHIAQRYSDVDYFILASTQDSLRVKIGSDRMNTLSGKLWPYREKIITHVIQPATNAKGPIIPSQPCHLKVESTASVDCERKSMEGDTINIHYKATLGDGTFIGSTYERKYLGFPISYTIGTGSLAGYELHSYLFLWNRGNCTCEYYAF